MTEKIENPFLYIALDGPNPWNNFFAAASLKETEGDFGFKINARTNFQETPELIEAIVGLCQEISKLKK